MIKICGSRHGPNFGVRPVANENFYLRLTVKKICAFAVFTDKDLQPSDCSDTDFTTVVNCKNPQTKIKLNKASSSPF